jgi:two-component system alkaline phosphatase synthesis response regulator PhoP
MTGQKILIVDDEQDILDLLAYNFKKNNMVVYTAINGKEAIALADKHKPDVILLDVMLPDTDGIAVCETLREQEKFDNTVIIFLSARGEDYTQIAGYKVGADDYVVKPVRIKILTEKIKTLLKRTKSKSSVNIERANIKIDKQKFTVSIDDIESVIPKKEFELLCLLIENPDKAFKRDEILEKVWGTDSFVGERTIDVHIRKLRERIGNERIKTIKGIGYRFA